MYDIHSMKGRRKVEGHKNINKRYMPKSTQTSKTTEYLCNTFYGGFIKQLTQKHIFAANRDYILKVPVKRNTHTTRRDEKINKL